MFLHSGCLQAAGPLSATTCCGTAWRARLPTSLVAHARQKNEGVYFEYGNRIDRVASAFDQGQFDWVRTARKEDQHQKRLKAKNRKRRNPPPLEVQALAAQAVAAPQVESQVEAEAETTAEPQPGTAPPTLQTGEAGEAGEPAQASSTSTSAQLTQSATQPSNLGMPSTHSTPSTLSTPSTSRAPAQASLQARLRQPQAPRLLLDDPLLQSAFYGPDDTVGEKLRELEEREGLAQEERLRLKLQVLGYNMMGSVAEDADESGQEGSGSRRGEGSSERGVVTTTGLADTPKVLMPKPPRRPT